MTTEWSPRLLAWAADVVSAAPEDAQPWCDFVLQIPTRLPAGCSMTGGTLRREAPPGRPDHDTLGRNPWSANNPSAYRFELAGPGRRLRVKQFVYEWVFPALDHPCLWKSETRARPIDNRYVMWLGVDYYGRPGASARLGRTTVEVSILDGEFSDDELLELYRSLTPVSEEAVAAIHATPFARLSYWARYLDASMVSVPIGLWVLRRAQSGPRTDRPVTDARAESLLRPLGLPSRLAGLGLDSAVWFTRAGAIEETEVIYTGGADRGHELRVIAQSSGQGPLEVPSRREPHPCARDTVRCGGAIAQLAWIDVDYGPFDAVLSVGEVDLKLLSSTGPGRGRDWFLGALDQLVTAVLDTRGVLS